MDSRPSSEIRSSTGQRGMKLKTFLTTVMSLLSILVLGLGGVRKDVLWLWIGFLCCLVSGVFVQLFINRIKDEIASGRR
jgi:1,4-dihydroxy-2-naphthoate octaprenyltransferase